MQKNSSGRATHQQQASATFTKAQLIDTINDAEAGIDALLQLLAAAHEPIAPASIARLLRPHHEALRRAADQLTDRT